MVVYVWSRRNGMVPVQILWFTFSASYLPYVLMLLSLLFGGSVLIDALGILCGHVYYALRDVLPLYLFDNHETVLLPTPQFLWVVSSSDHSLGNLYDSHSLSWQIYFDAKNMDMIISCSFGIVLWSSLSYLLSLSIIYRMIFIFRFESISFLLDQCQAKKILVFLSFTRHRKSLFQPAQQPTHLGEEFRYHDANLPNN